MGTLVPTLTARRTLQGAEHNSLGINGSSFAATMRYGGIRPQIHQSQETQMSQPEFTYDYVAINDLVVKTKTDPDSGKEIVDHVLVKDEPIQPSERFWTSLFSRFHINKAFFKYYEYAEVFDRIASVESSDRIRVCVERRKTEKGDANRLLAVTNPKSVIVPYNDLMAMLETSTHEGITYNDGIIESTHRPRVGASEFDILGDAFKNRFVMTTPVDGYGMPNVYLSLLRQICTNGVIAMSKTFRSSVALGKGDDNIAFALTRVLDQFSNDEGYAALRQRLESAGNSWASVYEATQLYKLLVRLHNQQDADGNPVLSRTGANTPDSPYVRHLLSGDDVSTPMGESEDVIGSPIITAYHAMTGDTSRLYGLANLDALSTKRQRTLPVHCTIYDMINFITEVATHHALPQASRLLHGSVGTLISAEYDMEGTCEKFKDFADFHISAKFQNNLTGSEYAHAG